MIHRDLGFLLLLLLGATTISQSTWISFARAAFWRTRIMPPATRRRRLSSLSPAPVTSFFSSKDGSIDKGNKSKPKSLSVVPHTKTSSSSSSFVVFGTQPPTTIAADHRSLLRSWANHSHADYHNFTEEEADGIRSALLEWYANNRRKLPWRGDPPPFDGSTSGINTSGGSNAKKRGRSRGANAAMKKTKTDGSNQKSITSFFSSTTIKTEEKGDSTTNNSTKSEQDQKGRDSVESDPLLDQAIPVTGYGVWVSEIMLQQTRVEAVIPFWIKWMKSFPTVYELATATEDEVNAHWAGLGFYRRARYLHQGAKYVVEELDGKLPTTPRELLKITGIGPYTASAISSIAFGVCVPVVDGNVCRVLSRLKGIANHIKHPILKDKLGWKLAAQIVEAGDGSSPGLVNQALMELGATYCAPAGSGIDDRDPLRDYYLSTQLGRAYLAALKDGGSDDICGDECSSLPSGTKRLTTTSVRGREKCCELCDPDGIHIVLERFRRSISLNSTTMDEAARIGHSAFPTDPPKTEKREEDLAMAVLMTSCSKKGDTANPNDSFRYLMVKRPKEGLLAGQWEFPNVCIQVRKKSKKEKNPTNNTKGPKKAERNRALTKFLLEELFLDHPNDEMPTAVSNQSRRAEKEPLEHVFSHVKHYMWVEFGDLIDVHLEDDDLEWVSPSGKEVRWMNKRDMKKVGITSGVKKVLQSVEKSLSGVSKSMSKRRKN